MDIPEPGRWTFNNNTIAAEFDSHVREQLPWYDLATGVVKHYVRYYLPEKGVIYDIGASNGNIGRSIGALLDERTATLIALESSKEMCSKYNAPGHITNAKAQEHEYLEFDVLVAFLTLMFIPVSERRALIDIWKGKLKLGGAIIVFDKSCNLYGELGQATYRLTLAAKYEQGANPDEIIAKELSLSGIQRPIDERNDLIGFEEVFRFGTFAGWVYQSPGHN